MIYLPQLEQEQLEPQLPIISISYWCLQSQGEVRVGGDGNSKNIQLEAPEHPHSPFMMMVLLSSGRTVWRLCLLVWLVWFLEFLLSWCDVEGTLIAGQASLLCSVLEDPNPDSEYYPRSQSDH